MKKKLLISALILIGAIGLTGCGRKIDQAVVPSDLATWLYKSTPDDGIDQTKNLGIDATVSKETRDKETGTITIPVEATVTDRSIYTGQFEVIYEKTDDESDEDGYRIKDVRYINRDDWVIEPVGPVDANVVKAAIIDRGKMIFAGSPVDLSVDNVANVAVIESSEDEDTHTVSANISFDVVEEIVTYHVSADVGLVHTINGYKIAEAKIPDFEVVLNDAFTFTVSDEDLIKMLKNSAMRVGDQSVDLANVSGLIEREDHFDPSDISMTIKTKMRIDNNAYSATANVYYKYQLDDAKEYWQLSEYTADNFAVDAWRNIKNTYHGKIGNTPTECKIVDFKDTGAFVAVFTYADETEMEMTGKIDPITLEVNMQEEDGTLKLKGVYSADLEAFKGNYGEKGIWYFQTTEGAERLRQKKTQQTESRNNVEQAAEESEEKRTENKDTKENKTESKASSKKSAESAVSEDAVITEDGVILEDL